MIKKLLFWFILVSLAGVIIQSCATSRLARSDKDKIIARVNGQEILLETLQQKIEELGYHSTSPQEDLQKKETALNEIIVDVIVKQKARALDLSNDQAFQEGKAEHMDKLLLDLLYEKEIIEKSEVTPEEIETYYRENPYEFYRIPDKAQVSRILIKIQADPAAPDYPQEEQETLDRILTIRQRIIDGEDFGQLAKEFSEDDLSGAKGGDMGFVSRGMLVPEFEDFIFSAGLNELSQPIKSPQGYNLLIVRERKQGEKRELDDEVRGLTKDYLKKEKANQKAADYLKELKEKASFVFNEDVLASADSLITDDPWVLVINQQDTIRYDYYSGLWKVYGSDTDQDTIRRDHKQNFLKDLPLVTQLLLRQDAKAKGYLSRPEYLEEEESYTLKMAVEKIKAVPAMEVRAYRPTETEVYDYYLANRQEYPTDSSIHVYHILFQDSALAEKVRREISSGADFVEMAEKYHSGTWPQGTTSYDLGFISDQMVPENFYKAAALLQVSEVSQPVRTEYGYHLIKSVERIKSLLDPYKPGIRNKMMKLKVQEVKERWERKLREESDIWIDQNLLRKIKLKKA
jgi:parvulin-like peptidyl-prolyl isomerase